MKKKNLERILNFIREEMMTTGSNVNTAGFSSKAPAKGPTAGRDKPMKKRYIYQRGVRKNWMKKDETQ
tara:strand:+ start:1447 stop:1650 length:204 start_codon:yes stop_codon:yes gene_type:complete